MGGTSSKERELGVPQNPRIQYAKEKKQKTGKNEILDVPVLMNLDNYGTIRYRNADRDDMPDGIREYPYEDQNQLEKKEGYFFHAKLNDYSKNAKVENEPDWKFKYVVKGANSANKQKLFYIYGKGMPNKMQPQQNHIESHEINPVTQVLHKMDNHVYYEMELHKEPQQDVPAEDIEIEDTLDMMSTSDYSQTLQFRLKVTDRGSMLKHKIAIKLVVPETYIHLFHHDIELGNKVPVCQFLGHTNILDQSELIVKLKPL